jgi:uncharacterized damage-inducible protein DinB
MDLVDRVSATPVLLTALVEGLAEEALARQPDGGGWSIKETAGHLCDVGRVMHGRLYVTTYQETPRLEGYDADDMASQRNAQGSSISDLLSELSEQRAETVELLTNLVHWNWARTGRHPQLGRLSIRQQVDLWIEHEDEHLGQIRALARA